MLDARCSMLDARCSMLDARCSMLERRLAEWRTAFLPASSIQHLTSSSEESFMSRATSRNDVSSTQFLSDRKIRHSIVLIPVFWLLFFCLTSFCLIRIGTAY